MLLDFVKQGSVVLALALLCMPAFADTPELPPTVMAFTDDAGRHFIPRGFVVVTEQGGVEDTAYTRDDYRRMRRLGANFQVVRLTLGPLGGWPGNDLQQAYLDKVEHLVGLGKEMGFKTCFKLTVYYSEGFDWTALWKNENKEQDYVVRAWQTIWERYEDEESIFGYDLLNEPHKGNMPDYRACERDNLVPLYQRLIDALRIIDQGKFTLVQPLLRENKDRPDHYNPFVEFLTPVEREGVVYAPHTYEGKPQNLEPTLDRYAEEAARISAPLMMGEWGPATFEAMDNSLPAQIKFQEIYLATTRIFDQRGLGGIKAWFTGTPRMLNSSAGNFTWSLFRDAVPVGTAERKYVMDFVARPGPLAIAGHATHYGFDFATRTFSMRVKANRKLGASLIYVGADRHYPDGFSVVVDGKPTVTHDPLSPSALRPLGDGGDVAKLFSWDEESQRLTIDRWPGEDEIFNLEIIPGTTGLAQVYPE